MYIKKDSRGYILLYKPNHPLCDKKGHILEHRYVMSEYLGRMLDKFEIVHHCDEDITNNDIDNLELMLKCEHSRLHQSKRKASEETKALYRKIRKGTNQKNKHPQWKQNVTINSIKKALLNNKTKKQAAKSLGICADTLRARINFYKSEGK
jgi:transcriptional regulator with PAS, ATPase and Fis domain